MNLLPQAGARVLGQGLTGAEGSTALPAMLAYGTNVIAGVTPGKGGQIQNGVPIFNSVHEALAVVGPVDAAAQFVPAKFVLAATREACEAGIGLIVINAEKVPTRDTAELIAIGRERGVSIVGPSSVGIINPSRRLKIGPIGGVNPHRMYAEGPIAVLSKSGGMTAEISLQLKRAGAGVSWAVGVGGDRLSGSDFADWLLALEEDPATKASILFSEVGGMQEERVAELLHSGRVKKPVIVFIAGDFSEQLPREIQFGHAGAIMENERHKPSIKRDFLVQSGALVVRQFDDIVPIALRLV